MVDSNLCLYAASTQENILKKNCNCEYFCCRVAFICFRHAKELDCLLPLRRPLYNNTTTNKEDMQLLSDWHVALCSEPCEITVGIAKCMNTTPNNLSSPIPVHCFE